MSILQEVPTARVTLARAKEIVDSGHLWIYAGFVHAVSGEPAAGDLVDIVQRHLGAGERLVVLEPQPERREELPDLDPEAAARRTQERERLAVEGAAGSELLVHVHLELVLQDLDVSVETGAEDLERPERGAFVRKGPLRPGPRIAAEMGAEGARCREPGSQPRSSRGMENVMFSGRPLMSRTSPAMRTRPRRREWSSWKRTRA